MCPIYKKGDREDPGNYHPVSLTSIVCKLMETALEGAILNHLQQTAALSAVQHGFIPHRSRDGMLLYLLVVHPGCLSLGLGNKTRGTALLGTSLLPNSHELFNAISTYKNLHFVQRFGAGFPPDYGTGVHTCYSPSCSDFPPRTSHAHRRLECAFPSRRGCAVPHYAQTTGEPCVGGLSLGGSPSWFRSQGNQGSSRGRNVPPLPQRRPG